MTKTPNQEALDRLEVAIIAYLDKAERDLSVALAKVERLAEALKHARPYVRQKAEAGDEIAEEELAKIDGALEAKE